MRFSMLITMDGNDSLKRVTSAKTVISEDGATGEVSRGRVPREWIDLRDVGSDHFIPRDEVDKWEIRNSSNSLHDEASENLNSYYNPYSL